MNCPICKKEYNDIGTMEACFNSHNEHEHLVWAAKELHRITTDCYNLFPLIDGVVSKYHLDD